MFGEHQSAHRVDEHVPRLRWDRALHHEARHPVRRGPHRHIEALSHARAQETVPIDVVEGGLKL